MDILNVNYLLQRGFVTTQVDNEDYFLLVKKDVSHPSGYRTFALPAYALNSLPSQTGNAGKILSTDGTNAVWINAGGSNPIMRYVYLVQDPQDALRMGGTVGNTYTTFQDAYNAAQVLQTANSGIVVIQVGNITGALAGNLTLTTNWNNQIYLNGINPAASVVGHIMATNAAGNGFNIGSTLASTYVRFTNLRVGNISTSATGATGNSGNVGITGGNLVLGNVTTSIVNGANTTGSAGGFRYNSPGNGVITAAAIATNVVGAAASAGIVSITASGNITSITTCNGQGVSGNIDLAGLLQVTTLTYNSSAASFGASIRLTNVSVATANINIGSNSSASPMMFNYCMINALNCTNNGNGVSFLYMKKNNIGVMTSNATMTVTSSGDNFNQIVGLGNNSKLANSVIDPVNAAVAGINGIGTGCKVLNCTILNGTFSINNGSAVSVIGTSSVLENAPGVNITMI